jgi:aminopeptidase N
MKKRENEVRRKMVVVRFNQAEYHQLLQFKRQTTEKTISNYLRKLAVNKPICVTYRNVTADEFLREMAELKNQLTVLGNHYNQAVKKLHLLEKVPEFRTWILMYESSRQLVLGKVDEINSKVTQLYEQWLRK